MSISRAKWMLMYHIIGAAQEVYNVLGRGMEEPLYQEAMEKELTMRNLSFKREVVLNTWYKGIRLKKTYLADFMCEDIIVEFKSASKIISDHRAQLFNYMRITKQECGILVNYGEDHFHSERYVYDKVTDRFELITKDNMYKYIEK